MSTALLISRDLFFTSKITGTASALGIEVQVAHDAQAATDEVGARDYCCIFIDLADAGLDVESFLSGLKSRSHPPVVAFGSHVLTAQGFSAANGAGMFATRQVNVQNNSLITRNRAAINGGGIADASTSTAFGVTITNSHVDGNFAGTTGGAGSGGGIIMVGAGTSALSLVNSTANTNTALGSGGGIANIGSSFLNLNNSHADSNAHLIKASTAPIFAPPPGAPMSFADIFERVSPAVVLELQGAIDRGLLEEGGPFPTDIELLLQLDRVAGRQGLDRALARPQPLPPARRAHLLALAVEQGYVDRLEELLRLPVTPALPPAEDGKALAHYLKALDAELR